MLGVPKSIPALYTFYPSFCPESGKKRRVFLYSIYTVPFFLLFRFLITQRFRRTKSGSEGLTTFWIDNPTPHYIAVFASNLQFENLNQER